MAVTAGETPAAAAYSQSVEFRVLGPIEYVNGGSPTPLGSPKQRAVLGMLLQSAGQCRHNGFADSGSLGRRGL